MGNKFPKNQVVSLPNDLFTWKFMGVNRSLTTETSHKSWKDSILQAAMTSGGQHVQCLRAGYAGTVLAFTAVGQYSWRKNASGKSNAPYSQVESNEGEVEMMMGIFISICLVMVPKNIPISWMCSYFWGFKFLDHQLCFFLELSLGEWLDNKHKR